MSSLDPAGQAELLKTNGYGPSNPEATKLLDAEWNKINPGDAAELCQDAAGRHRVVRQERHAWRAKN